MSYTPNLHFSRLMSTVYFLLDHRHYSSCYIAISFNVCLPVAFIVLLGFVKFLKLLVLFVLPTFIEYLARVLLFSAQSRRMLFIIIRTLLLNFVESCVFFIILQFIYVECVLLYCFAPRLNAFRPLSNVVLC